MNTPLNIIIVEDNFSFALELEMIVKKLGHIVLMDIDIKGKFGVIDIAEKVEHLKMPIIFITSYADDENYDKAANIDYTTYIIKPIDQYTLKSAINLLLKLVKGVYQMIPLITK